MIRCVMKLATKYSTYCPYLIYIYIYINIKALRLGKMVANATIFPAIHMYIYIYMNIYATVTVEL